MALKITQLKGTVGATKAPSERPPPSAAANNYVGLIFEGVMEVILSESRGFHRPEMSWNGVCPPR